MSPLYNGEVNASVYIETEISPLYNGEGITLFDLCNLNVTQWRKL